MITRFKGGVMLTNLRRLIVKKLYKDEKGESSLELLGFMFKILVITLLVFQLSLFVIDTSKYYIAINETIRRAQSEGRIRRDYFEEQLAKINKSPSEVMAIATPNFDTYVEKLGDKISLSISYDFNTSFSDLWSISIPINLRASRTNHGFYGTGYGGDW